MKWIAVLLIIVAILSGTLTGYQARKQQEQQMIPPDLELDSRYLATYQKLMQLVAVPIKDLTDTQRGQLRDSLRYYQGKLHAFQEARDLIRFKPH